MRYEKNSVWELTVEGMTNEGSGVARLDGYTVFIPDTAIGDVCRVKLVKCNKSYAYARLEEVLVPSPDRVPADCPAFLQCGGCVYRHIRYEAELRIKRNVVRDAFERIGGIHAPVRDILGSAEQEGYRNKAQYPVGRGADGGPVSGFYARRSHRIVPCESCALQPAVFGEIQREILTFLREHDIPAYDEASGKGLVRHIYLRRAEANGELMVCLVASSLKFPYAKELAARLTGRFPEIAGILLNKNTRRDNVILGETFAVLYGKETIRDVLCGVEVELSPRSFYQVNKPQAEVLYRKAIEYAALGEGDTILDLYCGAGTIGLAAAGQAGRLIGVEIIPEAVENARENARKNGVKNARFLCADAGQAAKTLAQEGIRPDVVVVDPPRKGLSEDVIEAIAGMSPKRVVMVSCNPATAARDAALLQDHGYRVEEITPVDLFPRTAHVECLINLCRQ